MSFETAGTILWIGAILAVIGTILYKIDVGIGHPIALIGIAMGTYAFVIRMRYRGY